MSDLVKISEEQIREAVAETHHLSTNAVCLCHDYEFVKRGGDKVRRDFIYGIIDKRGSKPTTNADRIRAMTDEELAVWIVHKTEGNGFDGYEEHVKSWLDWLKQEANDAEVH